MQHFGFFYYGWEPDFSKPPLCEIRDNMWAIRGRLVVFFLAQNRDHYILPCFRRDKNDVFGTKKGQLVMPHFRKGNKS